MSARRAAIRLTPRADLDLKGILNYTRRIWGGDQTATYRAAIAQSLAAIGEHPRRGQPRDDLFPGCRSARVEQHVIYYYQPQPNEIVVRRILLRRQDARADVPEPGA